MEKNNRFEFPSEEKRHEYLKNIIAFFQDERNEEIGFIAAENILNFFLETIGEDIYKKAIKDVQVRLHEKMADMDIDLDLLVGEKYGKF